MIADNFYFDDIHLKVSFNKKIFIFENKKKHKYEKVLNAFRCSFFLHSCQRI